MSEGERKPIVSIIMRSYNRSKTIGRAIDSILAQDFTDWELIVVDDGSTDDSVRVVSSYRDARIRIVKHDRNRGRGIALNTGLDHVRGEWFTLLDSDDEMVVPGALSTLLAVPHRVDESIDAITCNCIDTQTGKFSGRGLEHDQYLDAKDVIAKCRGEHWGLTKTSLLQGDRLSDNILTPGFLWYRIDKRARRYYVDKGLRLYHTEGEDRVSRNVEYDDRRTYCHSIAILNEKDYMTDYREYGRDAYRDRLFSAAISFISHDDKKRAFCVFRKLITLPGGLERAMIVLFGTIFGKNMFEALREWKHRHLNFKLR